MSEFRSLLPGGGEMGERIRHHDWSATPLGPPAQWPQSLWTVLSICLNSRFPTSIYWGPERTLLYNEAWSQAQPAFHPRALGMRGPEIWGELWPLIVRRFEEVEASGKGYNTIDAPLPHHVDGIVTPRFWDYSFTPIVGEQGNVVGILAMGQETTDRVLTRRNADFLVALDDRFRSLDTGSAIISEAIAMIGAGLQLDRVGYGEVDEAGSLFRIERCWSSAGMVEVENVLPFSAVSETARRTLMAGLPVAVSNSETDERVLGTPTAQRFIELGVKSALTLPVMRRGRMVALLFANAADPRSWSEYDLLLMNACAERIWKDVGRARARTVLRDSEQRHRLIFEQADDVIFSADLDLRITGCNPAAETALGLPQNQIVGRCMSDFLVNQEIAPVSEMVRRQLSQGGTAQYEVSAQVKDNRVSRWEINSTLAIDDDGNATGFHAIARDVTERRAYEDRQQLLIHELNHRVKNTLALVQGLALQSFAQAPDVDTGQDRFQQRLGMLAAAHDLLTRQQWEGAALAALVADATRPHEGAQKRIRAAGPAITLGPKAAISFVLALHELSTNAAKYGSLSRDDGRVSILWSIAGDRLRFEWRETGGPPVSPPERGGFGLRMIRRALASDLGGTVDVVFAADGLVCTIDAPSPSADISPESLRAA